MSFEDLPDIHAGGHAKRIQDDIDRLPIGEEGHVFLRHDLRNDALIAVAPRHLIAGLNLALHRDEDPHHLHDAGRQLIAALQLFDLVEKAAFEAFLGLVVLFAHGFELGHRPVVLDCEDPPLRARIILDDLLRELGIALKPLRSGDRFLACENVHETRVDVTVEDRELIVAVLRETLDLLALDCLGALVLVNAMPVKDAHFDDRALHPGRHPQRRIADIGRLLAEDRA
ncbi:MAG: hypothetical protein USCAAHI_03177 [Beijerinckiaceae bacterium]|nr:MAG: hypothetical protein USCAAHI_03177 [Beijerinckiaceae bacterium]